MEPQMHWNWPNSLMSYVYSYGYPAKYAHGASWNTLESDLPYAESEEGSQRMITRMAVHNTLTSRLGQSAYYQNERSSGGIPWYFNNDS